ncbi:hypothetical protein CONLIGDRAFT_695442 [Coniochaeta ligniaria NRRL 30616]|uniref:1-alkyl-2-acetylglycerophosphocholine esterase n=1 Tax=Coniochaeta ligniaria NRRL 30616 TaxID=1408157 RepID=A0A1J7JSV2_9PEZI|nr:hypothetical protein CONLIGDRAFT_695442 [Coniochaeta ligniaria NRRL 30616]
MHLLTFPLLLGAAQALLVPPPPGPYSVAVKHVELVDPSRTEPFAPEADAKRRFMASAYLPVDARYECQAQVVPYMPALTASVFAELGESLGVPQEMLAEFAMEFCDIWTVKLGVNAKKKEFPVAVFSPGFAGTRLVYGALARSLASLGYIVITVDHTYEALVVEFPDGSVAYAPDPEQGNETLTLPQLNVRTEDVSFLISQLSNTTLTASLFANFPGTFNPHKVAVYGHSFGGATAASTTRLDSRVAGGLNFDGTIYGPVAVQGFKGKPFVLVSRAVNSSAASVPEWDEFYNKIDGAKMELAVRDTQHYAFTDVPLLLTVYQVPPASQSTVEEVFGKLDGRKVERVVVEIMAGLLELLFNKETKPLEYVGRNPDIEVLLSQMPKCK